MPTRPCGIEGGKLDRQVKQPIGGNVEKAPQGIRERPCPGRRPASITIGGPPPRDAARASWSRMKGKLIASATAAAARTRSTKARRAAPVQRSSRR